MSVEQAKAFIERMKVDKVFSDRINVLEDAGAKIEAANNEGFDFIHEDMEVIAEEFANAAWVSEQSRAENMSGKSSGLTYFITGCKGCC